jgi:site-specific DNA-cytosine methylase
MDVSDEDIDKIQAAGISKSQQYKLAGNSICTNVLYYIFESLFINEAPEKQSIPQQLELF